MREQLIPKKKSIVVCKLRSDNFKMAYVCSDTLVILFSLNARKCFIKLFLHMLCLQIIRQLPRNLFSQIMRHYILSEFSDLFFLSFLVVVFSDYLILPARFCARRASRSSGVFAAFIFSA